MDKLLFFYLPKLNMFHQLHDCNYYICQDVRLIVYKVLQEILLTATCPSTSLNFGRQPPKS